MLASDRGSAAKAEIGAIGRSEMPEWKRLKASLCCYLAGAVAGLFAFTDDRTNAAELFFVLFFAAGLALTIRGRPKGTNLVALARDLRQ